jgi:glycosyltransferase involved in cell wall biosynthesis
MAESSSRVIIDLRCLQDGNYAGRGIGRYARGFILNRPQDVGQVIGLIDPELPELPKEIIGCVDAVRADGGFPGLVPGSVFINPSPMTADPLFTARLVGDSRIRRVAVVYDFIPLDDARRYLCRRAARLDYAARLAWLSRYDLFLPISEPTERRLHELFGPRPSFVTGVPLPAWIGPAAGAIPRHILGAAGDDPRKNPEVVIRAHAVSRIIQERRIPLIITGSYQAGPQAAFCGLAKESGGDGDLLVFPGYVGDEALCDIYQNAVCVVTASRAEGFSLPVVEAMAAGVPSVGSDIRPHAVLIKDPALRFHPENFEALRAILEQIVLDTEYRESVIAAQAKVWPEFAAKAVASKIWSAIAAPADMAANV